VAKPFMNQAILPPTAISDFRRRGSAGRSHGRTRSIWRRVISVVAKRYGTPALRLPQSNRQGSAAYRSVRSATVCEP
jgi:hypothetical protein